ncbi:MAG: DEAD/DEAH box helicase [Enterobacterales bacterium]
MSTSENHFINLGLKSNFVKAINALGYNKPSPIQLKCIPYLLSGKDVLGIAQTGSGKTAAFALPFLSHIKKNINYPQILILTPTRELTIQIKKACVDFTKYIKGINILALYGGQRYDIQLRGLKLGPQVIVGTPGRLLDHLKRKTLNLSKLIGLVLDEADEMLKMGFIEDVESILSKIPEKHQTALFSATMPEVIKRITRRFMKKPKEIRIQCDTYTRPDIHQSYWIISRRISKSEALIRFLEYENFSAALIFVRTKIATVEVSESLENSGYKSAALNGDMQQSLREKTLDRLKNGNLDILIATDVAARGLDVDRINLVINYDIPRDYESYQHRIGRTGRAGRTGKALLFVEYRDKRLLRNIERMMKIKIKEVYLPNSENLSKRRIEKFCIKINSHLNDNDLNKYKKLINDLIISQNIKLETLSSILLKIAQGSRKLIIKKNNIIDYKYNVRKKHIFKDKNNKSKYKKLLNKKRFRSHLDAMDKYSIDIGKNDGIEVRHIVGTIINEGKIKSNLIGNIKLFNYYSTVELIKGVINKDLLLYLSKTKILNKTMNMKYFSKNCFTKNKKI